MENFELYKNAATAVKTHLKHTWEYLEQQVEYVNFLLLRGEVQNYDPEDKEGSALQKSVLNKVKRLISKDAAFEEREIFVDNTFADLFEEYFAVISALQKIKTDDASSHSAKLEEMYTQIAAVRTLIKKTDAFITLLDEPIALPDGERIKDDRIELTLHSLQQLTGTQTEEKSRDYKKLLFLRVFGRPCFFLAVISLIIFIALVTAETVIMGIKAKDLEYLKQESIEAYNAAVNALGGTVLVHPVGKFLFVVTQECIWIGLLSALLYLIIGRIVLKKLKQVQDPSPALKYLLAWAYIDMGISPFIVNMEEHRLLMLEAAEDGYVDAYVRLGVLYEKGHFSTKKEKMSEKDRLENAMRCYKHAFPNKKAIEKFNKAKAKLENVQ